MPCRAIIAPSSPTSLFSSFFHTLSPSFTTREIPESPHCRLCFCRPQPHIEDPAVLFLGSRRYETQVHETKPYCVRTQQHRTPRCLLGFPFFSIVCCALDREKRTWTAEPIIHHPSLHSSNPRQQDLVPERYEPFTLLPLTKSSHHRRTLALDLALACHLTPPSAHSYRTSDSHAHAPVLKTACSRAKNTHPSIKCLPPRSPQLFPPVLFSIHSHSPFPSRPKAPLLLTAAHQASIH